MRELTLMILTHLLMMMIMEIYLQMSEVALQKDDLKFRLGKVSQKSVFKSIQCPYKIDAFKK